MIIQLKVFVDGGIKKTGFIFLRKLPLYKQADWIYSGNFYAPKLGWRRFSIYNQTLKKSQNS